MTQLDLTFPTPAENLACDEALLDFFEERGGNGVLRFWEPENYFVVVGYGNQVEKEVNVAACTAEGIPILRRCSGGGTVLQGPGCLNYSLIAKIEENGPLSSITSANRFIMERNREAMEKLIPPSSRRLPRRSEAEAGEENPSPDKGGTKPADSVRWIESKIVRKSENPTKSGPLPGAEGRGEGERKYPSVHWPALIEKNQSLVTSAATVEIRGCTDLALVTHQSSPITSLKFSGNAQRRKKLFLLFHGTFLLDFDIPLIDKFLRMPSKEPDYRQGRSHTNFLTNLEVSADAVKRSLRQAWEVSDGPAGRSQVEMVPYDGIALLARDKYVTKEWNFKF